VIKIAIERIPRRSFITVRLWTYCLNVFNKIFIELWLSFILVRTSGTVCKCYLSWNDLWGDGGNLSPPILVMIPQRSHVLGRGRHELARPCRMDLFQSVVRKKRAGCIHLHITGCSERRRVTDRFLSGRYTTLIPATLTTQALWPHLRRAGRNGKSELEIASL
jgi:hypothetical protein